MQTAAPEIAAHPRYRDFYYRSSDGLLLHARDYGDATAIALPVVCLPGLTRTARDFDALAGFLAYQHQPPRRVVTFEYRGRGESDWDAKPANYAIGVEMADAFDGMAAIGISRAGIVGTSRGGIIAMAMAFTRPQTVAALVLNDIGPLIEPQGLMRLKSYVGRTPPAGDWAEARQIQRKLHGAQFTSFHDGDWDVFARLTYRDSNGRPESDYDPHLAQSLAGDVSQPTPGLWDEFRALASIPTMVIRGANSDILSVATVERMQKEHPRLTAVVVPDQGHPPQLTPGPLLVTIAGIIDQAEATRTPVEVATPDDQGLSSDF